MIYVNVSKQTNEIKSIVESIMEITKDIFVAGGALTSIFTKQPINDLDFYFKNKQTLEDTLQHLTDDNWFLSFASKKALTLVKGEEIVQLIYYKYFNSIQDIFKEFDFSVNMCAFDGDSKSIIMHEDFLPSLANREILFNQNTPYPIISLYRTKKYLERGYIIPTQTTLKIGMAISNLNITSWEGLEDQLGGVYGELNLTGKHKDIPFNMNYAIDNFSTLFVIKTETPNLNAKKLFEISGLVNDSLPGNHGFLNFNNTPKTPSKKLFTL